MTRAQDAKPTKRIISDRDGQEYVIEVGYRTLRMRPLRSRRGGPADKLLAPGAIYVRQFIAELEVKQRAKRKGRRGSRGVR